MAETQGVVTNTKLLKKVKNIIFILDSHQGELQNISAMLFYWGSLGELKNSNVNIYYIGSTIEKDKFFEELESLNLGFIHEVTFIPIVSSHLGLFSKALNFCRLFLKLFLKRNIDTLFVPYDQKKVFYFLLNFFRARIYCIPHTLGKEIYNDEIFNNRIRKFRKKMPVIAKEKGSEAYFKSLGYDWVIYAGNYILFDKYISQINEKFDGPSVKTDWCIFTYHRKSVLFSESDWLETHSKIFASLSAGMVTDVAIKLHPSQDLDDFKILSDLSSQFGLKIHKVFGNPVAVAHNHKYFIVVLTSAGQITEGFGFPTCSFALPQMRQSVASAKLDPFPYARTTVKEITTAEDLKKWINDHNFVNSKEYSPSNKEKLMSLNEIREAVWEKAY